MSRERKGRSTGRSRAAQRAVVRVLTFCARLECAGSRRPRTSDRRQGSAGECSAACWLLGGRRHAGARVQMLRVFFCLTDRNHIVPALMGMPACSGLSG